jgi:integrase
MTGRGVADRRNPSKRQGYKATAGRRANAPGPDTEASSMPDSKVATRQRHVPVARASHVYKSQRTDGSWVYEVRHPRNANGKRPFEVVGARLDEAKARAAEIYRADAPRVSNLTATVADVYEDWKAYRKVKISSAEVYDTIYRSHILPALGHRRVRDLDKIGITRWVEGLTRKDGREGPLSETTRHYCLVVLDILLKHGVDMGALAVVPKIDRARKPRPAQGKTRILSAQEEAALLLASAAWLRPIIQLMLWQGLRIGEVCGISWEDVDFAGSKLHVRRSVDDQARVGTTKAGKEASIRLTASAAELLRGLGPHDEGWIFAAESGGPLTPKVVRWAFDTAARRAQLEDVTPHTCRHTAVSRLANSPGVSLARVQGFARHASLQMTQRYMHPVEDPTQDEAMDVAVTGKAAVAAR